MVFLFARDSTKNKFLAGIKINFEVIKMGFLWFGFSEEKIKRKLERLHSAIKGSPEGVDNSEKLLLKYETEIQKNLGKIEDKDSINAQIQAVRQEIDKARAEVKEEAELKPAMA